VAFGGALFGLRRLHQSCAAEHCGGVHSQVDAARQTLQQLVAHQQHPQQQQQQPMAAAEPCQRAAQALQGCSS
jgi:hypothetical protein